MYKQQFVQQLYRTIRVFSNMPCSDRKKLNTTLYLPTHLFDNANALSTIADRIRTRFYQSKSTLKFTPLSVNYPYLLMYINIKKRKKEKSDCTSNAGIMF